MSQSFDVVVIGGGPGGYIAAIRAAQLGFKVACVDAFENEAGKPSLGGTCLNVGCIPSKALLQSSEHFAQLKEGLSDHGILVQNVQLDLAQMMARKTKIVGKLALGIAYLFKKNKITSFSGKGRLRPRSDERWPVEIAQKEQVYETIEATHVVIASGSVPRPLPQIAFDQVHILDNVGALSLSAVPRRLGIIGAGVIGLEMGSVWSRLGAEVTVLEMHEKLLPTADEAIAEQAACYFEKSLNIQLGVTLGEIECSDGDGVYVHYSDATAQKQRRQFDRLIVAIGRTPYTDGLGAAEIALEIDSRGQIAVDDLGRTNLPNIWAIGDVVRGPMLAHKAMDEGVAVAERIAGQHPHLDLGHIPWVIYTQPEIAWVGQTEQQLKAQGYLVAKDYRVGISTFKANGRALGLGHTDGLVKLLACAKTDRLLGAHIIGPNASELIAEPTLAMSFSASAEDIARTVHAHPSLSEALHEAALAVDKRALHG